MPEDFSSIERLLNIPEGSTVNTTPEAITPVLVDGVENKTKELVQRAENATALAELSKSDLVKSGISEEALEVDRNLIRNESFEVYRIGKALLVKLYDDVKDQIGVTDRMYASCAKLLDSVNSSLGKLFEMNQKLKQEEEMKGLALLGDDSDDSSRMMSPDQWMEFVEASVEDVKVDDPTPTIPDKIENDKSENDEK